VRKDDARRGKCCAKTKEERGTSTSNRAVSDLDWTKTEEKRKDIDASKGKEVEGFVRKGRQLAPGEETRRSRSKKGVGATEPAAGQKRERRPEAGNEDRTGFFSV